MFMKSQEVNGMGARRGGGKGARWARAPMKKTIMVMFYVNQPPYVRESENGSTFFARSSRRGRHGQWRGQNLVVVGALERWGMGRVSSSHGKGV